jgi:hypothetical protein
MPTLVTHLAKKALKMRHKIPPHQRNPLKNNGLKLDF